MARVTFYMSEGDLAHNIPLYELTLSRTSAEEMLENSGFIPMYGGTWEQFDDGTIAFVEEV